MDSPQFWTVARKILFSKSLSTANLHLGSQNIDFVKLIRKILRNRYLAYGLETSGTPFGCGNDRTFRLWMTRADVTRSNSLPVDICSGLLLPQHLHDFDS